MPLCDMRDEVVRTCPELRRQSRMLFEAAKTETDIEFRRALAAGAFALAQQAEAMEREGPVSPLRAADEGLAPA